MSRRIDFYDTHPPDFLIRRPQPTWPTLLKIAFAILLIAALVSRPERIVYLAIGVLAFGGVCCVVSGLLMGGRVAR